MPRTGGTFVKGQKRPGQGRPKGSQNKTTLEVRAFARRVLEDDHYRDRVQQRILLGQAPHLETLLYHYAYGKPKDVLSFDSDQEPVTVRIVHQLDRSTSP